jgi:hypothetical protein
MNFVLKHWHPMVGIDYHIPWPPGSPTPLPAPAPYYTAQLLIGLFPTIFSKPIPSHITDGYAITMEQGTDIGSLIPHIGVPSVILPLELAFSYSKSYFGASRYLAENKVMACALLVSVNPNLNCGTPLPTPTGFVLALTTHIVEMSLADVLTGLFRMALDAALQWALSKFGGALSSRLGRAIARRMVPSVWVNAYCRGANLGLEHAWAQAYARAAAREAGFNIRTATGVAVGFIMGGPLGADAGTFGAPTPGGWVASQVGGDSEAEDANARAGYAGRAAQSAADWASPPPAVVDHNTGAGAPPILN